MSTNPKKPTSNGDLAPAERFAGIFKAYDVRGLSPEHFDAPMAKAVGAAQPTHSTFILKPAKGAPAPDTNLIVIYPLASVEV